MGQKITSHDFSYVINTVIVLVRFLGENFSFFPSQFPDHHNSRFRKMNTYNSNSRFNFRTKIRLH